VLPAQNPQIGVDIIAASRYSALPEVNPLPPIDAVQKQKKYFRESFQFSIVTIKKNITPLET